MESQRQPAAVITCNFQYLLHRCAQRNYTLQEVMPCVLKQDGDNWTIDTGHPAYPKTVKPGTELIYTSSAKSGEIKCKAGVALKALLKKWLNITATENCSCNARAAFMDEKGCDWCEQNIDLIVKWLREEAEKRRLPFIDLAGKILVKRAIHNARKAEQNERQSNSL